MLNFKRKFLRLKVNLGTLIGSAHIWDPKMFTAYINMVPYGLIMTNILYSLPWQHLVFLQELNKERCYPQHTGFTLVLYTLFSTSKCLINLPIAIAHWENMMHYGAGKIRLLVTETIFLISGMILWLTLNLLTTTIVAPPSNASKWQMGFNSAFKGLIFI